VEPKFGTNDGFVISENINQNLPTETPKFNINGGFFSKQVVEDPKTPLRKSTKNDSSFDLD
jgi:hypothetical protein